MTTNDFLVWLAENNLMLRYWRVMEYTCYEKKITVAAFISQLDANNPDSLFDMIIESEFFYFVSVKRKYTEWLKGGKNV